MAWWDEKAEKTKPSTDIMAYKVLKPFMVMTIYGEVEAQPDDILVAKVNGDVICLISEDKDALGSGNA